MGIDLNLHSKPGQSIDQQELAERLIKAGAIPYPEDPAYDTNGYFMLPGVMGNLRIVPEYYSKEGEWAWVRLSWAASTESWKHLLDIAEQIKGRIYDSNLDQYITYEIVDYMVKYYSFGVEMLGKADKYKEDATDSKTLREASLDKRLIEPLFHIKKLLGNPENPSKMCYEIAKRTSEQLDANPGSEKPLIVLDDNIKKLLTEKRREERIESMNMELWFGIKKVKYFTWYYNHWFEGIMNATKDFSKKTTAEKRISIAKEMNEAIDKIVQEIKQQNRNQSK